MPTYTIDKLGSGLSIVETTSGVSSFWPNPRIEMRPNGTLFTDTQISGIKIVSGTDSIRIQDQEITTVGGVAASGTLAGIYSQLAGLLSSASTVVRSNVTGSGNLAALNAAVTLTLNGLAGVGIHVAGTWVGTLAIEGTIDGTTWAAINMAPLSGGARVATISANNEYEGIAAGLLQVRLRFSAYTSGTANVSMLATSDTRIRRAWSTNADNFLVKPVLTGGGNTTMTTHATVGATYVAFAAQVCSQLTIVNDTGLNIEVQQGGSGVALPVFANTAYTFFGITDASQLGVRRVDVTPTAVTVKARWES